MFKCVAVVNDSTGEFAYILRDYTSRFYVCCDNPNCPNAYHYMKEVSYNVLQQD